jgi:mRNA deadenylase 3'-5' endonuclease subunit Ccr4
VRELKPHVLCLQEVGHKDLPWWEAELAQLGYHGSFKKRTGIDKPDGVATFYLVSHFRLLRALCIEYESLPLI